MTPPKTSSRCRGGAKTGARRGSRGTTTGVTGMATRGHKSQRSSRSSRSRRGTKAPGQQAKPNPSLFHRKQQARAPIIRLRRCRPTWPKAAALAQLLWMMRKGAASAAAKEARATLGARPSAPARAISEVRTTLVAKPLLVRMILVGRLLVGKVRTTLAGKQLPVRTALAGRELLRKAPSTGRARGASARTVPARMGAASRRSLGPSTRARARLSARRPSTTEARPRTLWTSCWQTAQEVRPQGVLTRSVPRTARSSTTSCASSLPPCRP
mmetsp:Transcript_104805/g.323229  ORF Transcript_104805/g.323229 Transcript_104805/m.323229 type:complete len:270 (-) Transcript_104805:3192-4001(-)